jgi:hypothetical protein
VCLLCANLFCYVIRLRELGRVSYLFTVRL